MREVEKLSVASLMHQTDGGKILPLVSFSIEDNTGDRQSYTVSEEALLKMSAMLIEGLNKGKDLISNIEKLVKAREDGR